MMKRRTINRDERLIARRKFAWRLALRRNAQLRAARTLQETIVYSNSSPASSENAQPHALFVYRSPEFTTALEEHFFAAKQNALGAKSETA